MSRGELNNPRKGRHYYKFGQTKTVCADLFFYAERRWKGLWEAEFHKAFCATCGQTDCGACPHEKERSNPLWWLTQVADGEQTARRAVWRKGQVELEPGMIVPLQEELPANGICNEFNVYLNGKGRMGRFYATLKG